MTFQNEIDAALAKPVDQEARNLLHSIPYPAEVIAYTLLLRIRDLEASQKAAVTECEALKAERNQLNFKLANAQAKVENERWRDAAKEKPDKSGMFLAAYDDGVAGAEYDSATGNWFGFNPDGFLTGDSAPTHWKPINLHSVLTK